MKNKDKRGKNRGSATILVILIVIAVMLFGVMSMMSVFTSYKISLKNLQWTNNYYNLDSKAQIFANNIKKTIAKTKKGQLTDVNQLLKEIEKNADKDREIYLNDKILKFPSTKDEKTLKDKDIRLAAFLLDEKGQKSFYFELLIPKIRGDKPFEIVSWKKVTQEFEYKNPTFVQGEELIIDEN